MGREVLKVELPKLQQANNSMRSQGEILLQKELHRRVEELNKKVQTKMRHWTRKTPPHNPKRQPQTPIEV